MNYCSSLIFILSISLNCFASNFCTKISGNGQLFGICSALTQLFYSILLFSRSPKFSTVYTVKGIQQYRQGTWMNCSDIKPVLPTALFHSHKSLLWRETERKVFSPVNWYKLKLNTVNVQGDICFVHCLGILQYLHFTKNKQEGTGTVYRKY